MDPQTFTPTVNPAAVQKPLFLGIIWAGTAICSCALAFRIYVRGKFFHKLLIDDFFACFAWVLQLSTAILWTVISSSLYEMLSVLSGQAYPTATFLHSLGQYLHGSLAVLLMFYLGLWTIKINFLLFFRKLGDQVKNYYRIYWWIVTVFTMAAGAVCIGTIQYSCLAIPTVQSLDGKCTQPEAIRFQDITLKVNCGLDVVTDAMILSMPISMLWRVHMSLKRKLQLGGLFSLVIITMVIAIVRVTVISNQAASSGRNQVEITWLYMWHFIENSVALLVACLASFRTLFAAKERQATEEERIKREQAIRERGPRSRVLWARAKHFQDSLFNTMKTTEGTTKVASQRSDGMEYPLKPVGNGKNSYDIEHTEPTFNQSLNSVPSHGGA
ncbi:hypothetical protein HYFRA_00004744, partial [Hymenoscyphus fraxineus]